MGTIILLALLIWSVWDRVRSLFATEIVKTKPEPDIAQYAGGAVLVIFILQAALAIWAALVVSTSVALIGCAIVLFIIAQEDAIYYERFKDAAQGNEETVLFKKTAWNHIMNLVVLVYDFYLLYAVVMMVLGR